MPPAARQTAQAHPQQPGPQPQGQLQLLPLSQHHQLPQDQHLGDHSPGPEDQDDALQPRQAEEVTLGYLGRVMFYDKNLWFRFWKKIITYFVLQL
jgi:hypothetical protein